MSEVYCLLGGARLLGYGESDTSGKWLKFEIPQDPEAPDYLEKFRGLKGQCFDLAIEPVKTEGEAVPVGAESIKKKKGPYGEYAKALKLSGFFRAPQVWEALGSDKDYLDWVTYQPSCISGEYSEFDENEEGRCIAAHVRRVRDGAGTGMKPRYSAVPLTFKEHQIQHESGESGCLDAFLRKHERYFWGEEAARDWFDRQRINYVERWAWETFRKHLLVDSMSEVSPQLMYDWAKANEVENLLPNIIKEAV